MAIIKIDAFQCDKCKYIWISHKFDIANPPACCSYCKSAYWNRGAKKSK